jgi:hypothetical protein
VHTLKRRDFPEDQADRTAQQFPYVAVLLLVPLLLMLLLLFLVVTIFL